MAPAGDREVDASGYKVPANAFATGPVTKARLFVPHRCAPTAGGACA